MDTVKIGNFLATLRKEHNMIQEQLGEKIGVTNKTISRWENGNYLPPVDKLQDLSLLYNISINEILSAEKLDEYSYRKAAEINLKETLSFSAFSVKERVSFYKKRWKRAHVFINTLEIILIVFTIILGIIFDNGLQLIAIIVAFVWYTFKNNQMMTYVENHVYSDHSNIHTS